MGAMAFPGDETEMNDEEARLRRAAAGSAADVERLYADHVDGLYAFVFYRVGREAAIAEDVVQDTFLQALEHAADYDGARGSVRNWMCTLSRNVIRKHLREHPRVAALHGTWERIDKTLAAVFEQLDSAPLSDEVIAREETRDLVNMTIANLPDHYRAILERKYVSGESLEQLAGELALTEEAAKSLLARARRAFRETFLTLSRSMAEAV